MGKGRKALSSDQMRKSSTTCEYRAFSLRPTDITHLTSNSLLSHSFPDAPDAESSATGVVHFLVTSLTPELSAPPSEANGDDYEVGQMTRLGRLGAVVDPSLTNMVQTGVVGSQVADWDAWLGVVSGTPPLPSPSTVTPLSNPTSPFGRICQLLQATLLPDASTYGIHLTVLLKGARGSGKKTVVRWAAKKTGVHLIEVSTRGQRHTKADADVPPSRASSGTDQLF